jgi:hypothetical protein
MIYILLFLGGIALIQDHLLYFPEKLPLPRLLEDARRDDLRAWPPKGEWRGLVREPQGPVRATLLLFHGNAGHAGHRSYYANLARLGLRVILAEYPGYGPREGSLSEEFLVSDAAETIRRVKAEFREPLLLAGESLGAGVAAAAHARVPDAAAAVLLITPWDTLANIASHHYPWLPVRLLLRDRYDSVAHLSTRRNPVAVVVAERDSVVPARYGKHLFDEIPGAKRMWQISGADHNDWVDHLSGEWWEGVLAYLLAQPPPPN